MICEYGCGQDAKYYFPTVNKWCCSSHFSKCSKRKENSSGENNPMYGKDSAFKGKHHSKKSIEKMKIAGSSLKDKTYEEIYGKEKAKKLKEIKSKHFSKINKGRISSFKNKTHSKEARKAISIARTYVGKDYKIKHPEFYEIEKPIFKNNKIYVKCKHCNKLFSPKKSQINERLRSIRIKVYKNFLFCSTLCKANSDYFDRKIDPDSDHETKFKIYSNQVWKYTRLTLKTHHIKDIELRGRNQYHLDHKFSIYEGYKNNINPKLLSHNENLQMIPERKNIQKGSKCSITLQELLSF